MNLARSRIHWEDMGVLDPYWAILSEPTKKNGRWETTDFFAIGKKEISLLMNELRQLDLPRRQQRALDFGCGVGRLTRALARHFNHVTGIDISGPMISRASSLNADERCTFIVSDCPTLPFASETFDLILSSIVLQHVPQQSAIRQYIAEFARTLRPGGMIVTQLPSYIPLRRRLQARRRLYAWLRAVGISEEVLYNQLRLHPIPMNYLPEREVCHVLESNRCQVLKIVPDNRAGAHIESRTYYATKS